MNALVIVVVGYVVLLGALRVGFVLLGFQAALERHAAELAASKRLRVLLHSRGLDWLDDIALPSRPTFLQYLKRTA